MKTLKKILHRNSATASECDAVFQSWLLQLPPARGLKKYLFKSHWRWAVFRYIGPQEGIVEFYANDRCTRLASKIRITRKDKVEAGMSFNPGVATSQLNMFSISSGKQVHYLVAETQNEAEQWVFALCSACGLDIPGKSTPFLRTHRGEQEYPTVSSLSGEPSSPKEETDHIQINNSDYILLSSCFSSQVPTRENIREGKRESFSYLQEKNLCLSSHHVNYDHPKPISRSRLMTSPDLRGNYSHPRSHRRPSNSSSGQSNTLSDVLGINHEILPESSDLLVPEMARHDQNEDVDSLDANVKWNSRLEKLKSDMGKSLQMLDFNTESDCPSEVTEDAPPPRPPKPPHLCQTSQSPPSEVFMIHADLVFPIYDKVPKPRKVLQNPVDQAGCSHASDTDACSTEEDKVINSRESLQTVVPLKDYTRQQSQDVTKQIHIKISPNTRVSRPLGGLWDSGITSLKDGCSHPKFVNTRLSCTETDPSGIHCDSALQTYPGTVHASRGTRTGSDNLQCREGIAKLPTSSEEPLARNYSTNPIPDPKKGVKMRRRPPTPPSTAFCNFSFQTFPVDLKTAVPLTTALNQNPKRKEMRPLTQEQRFSISKEMNYLDLAFVSNEPEYSNPRPLTRETVYYSVDFIRTWAFNATRKDVEEIYRNMQNDIENK